MKILNKIKENKIFFVTFGALMYVSFAYLVQKENIHYIDNYYYPLYVINYDCGFSSRLFIGAIYSLFFGEKLSIDALLHSLLIIYTVVCFLFSLTVNNYLKRTNYKAIGIYTLFMVASPAALAFLRYLGTLDLFLMFFVLGSLYFVNKKGLRWLVPVFCVVSLCLYDLFATTYLPLMAIAVFYQFVKKPNVSNFIYIAVCAVVVGFATVYFLILGDSTMKMTSEQMVEFARGRLEAPANNFDEYYLRSVFFWETPQVENYHGFLGYIKYNFEHYIHGDRSAVKMLCFFIVSNLLTSIPFVYLIAKALKKAETPLKKFIYFCSFAPILCMLINLLLSTDPDRFSLHFLLSVIFTLLFFVSENDTAFSEAYNDGRITLKKNKTLCAIIGLCIAGVVLTGVKF